MSGVNPPEEWKGKFVPFLDVMMFMREKVHEGVTPEIYFGRIDVRALANFVDGICHYMRCCGVRDDQAGDFFDWLREKGEFVSPGGWAEKYLADCHGDHRAAIMKFLDRGAEFAAIHRRPKVGGAS